VNGADRQEKETVDSATEVARGRDIIYEGHSAMAG